MIYLFVLGRDPELARMEIECILENESKFRILENSKNVAAVECENINPEIIKKLGGTIKIAKVISNTNDAYDIENNLENCGLYNGDKNKIEYYIDHYSTSLLNLTEDILKDYFKRMKIKALYKKTAEPSKLTRKDILKNGLNLVIYKNYIGKVIAVTNPIELKTRDIGRPSVDYAKVISIRLAKILINLSKVKKGETLLDPFAGSGTILQEAMLQGVNAIGADNDVVSINDADKNLKWIRSKYATNSNFKIIKSDVINLAEKIREGSIDAVVTEPYMGPFIRKLPNIPEAKNLASDLSMLYSDLLKNLKKLEKKGKRTVIIIPVFRTRENKKIFINFRNMAESCGFSILYEPITYGHSKNKLLRQVYVLEKL